MTTDLPTVTAAELLAAGEAGEDPRPILTLRGPVSASSWTGRAIAVAEDAIAGASAAFGQAMEAYDLEGQRRAVELRRERERVLGRLYIRGAGR
jgi:hypothetical protein